MPKSSADANNTESETRKVQLNIIKTQNNTESTTKLSYIQELVARLRDTLQYIELNKYFREMDDKKLTRKIRIIIIVFVVFLALSGITAFPIETELKILYDNSSIFPDFIRQWLTDVYYAVKNTNTKYPFLSYGTDWLAFAHLVIAVAFIGPLRNPVKNIWVIEFGMIACLMVFPLAFIAGAVRGIPLYWRLIDCSFGIIGLIPLIWCHKLIKRLEHINKSN